MKNKLDDEEIGKIVLELDEIDDIKKEIIKKIKKINNIKTKLQSVKDCCDWKNKLIKECDDAINKY